jgi:hypothetical protein
MTRAKSAIWLMWGISVSVILYQSIFNQPHILDPPKILEPFNNRSYVDLFKIQQRICGELCQPGPWRNTTLDYSVKQLQDWYVSKAVDCPRLFSKEVDDILESPPFEAPPRELPLRDAFTLGGHVPVNDWFFGGSGTSAISTPRIPRWTNGTILRYKDALARRVLSGTYGAGPTNAFADILKQVNLTGLHVMVIGSAKPWAEVAALAAGARLVITLEYGKIVSEWPQIRTLTPSEFNEHYRNGTLPKIDIAISYSSLEHSGLGRYGDGINPWGDVITSAKIRCVVPAILFGVPSGPKDILHYNAHREYGPNRWPLLLTNWWPVAMWREKAGQFENGIVYAVGK